MTWKVTKEDLTSPGLRRYEPIQYIQNEWVYPESEKGGLYVARIPSAVRWLRKYLKEKYNINTRVFECEIGKKLYESKWMIETDKVLLKKEVYIT